MGEKANVLVGVAQITIGTGLDSFIVGYTADGATMTIRSDYADIKVHENEGSVIRKLIDQEVRVTLNLAEGTLENLSQAIPGCELDGNTLTIGGGSLQEVRLRLIGKAPDAVPAEERTIILNKVNPIGEVSIPYKKGEVSVVPVTFAALIDDDGEFGDVEDAVPVELTDLTEDLDADFVPEFDGGTYIYTLEATDIEDAVTLTATLEGATITYYYTGEEEGKEVVSGVPEVVPLAEGENLIVITVALATYGTRDYRITVTKAAPE